MYAYAVEQAERAPWPFQLAWILLVFGTWAVALRDTIKHSEQEFRAVGSSKSKWVALLLLFGPFAAVPYLVTLRRRLRGHASSAA